MFNAIQLARTPLLRKHVDVVAQAVMSNQLFSGDQEHVFSILEQLLFCTGTKFRFQQAVAIGIGQFSCRLVAVFLKSADFAQNPGQCKFSLAVCQGNRQAGSFGPALEGRVERHRVQTRSDEKAS